MAKRPFPGPIHTAWPKDLLKLVKSFHKLKPSDLPPEPWMCGPTVTVRSNEVWLRYIAPQVKRAPNDARFRHGVLQEDLRWLKQAVKEARAKEAGEDPPPPYVPEKPPRSKPLLSGEAIKNKRDLVTRINSLALSAGLDRQDANDLLRARCGRTLTTAKRSDLDWLQKALADKVAAQEGR